MEEDKLYEEGLSTNLISKWNSAIKSSYQLESFLTQVERELLSIGWDTEIPENKEKDQEMRRLLQILEESEIVTVPTEKKTGLEVWGKRNRKLWWRNTSNY